MLKTEMGVNTTYIYLYRSNFFYYKIGYTTNPRKRVTDINTYNPLPPETIRIFRMPGDGRKWKHYDRILHAIVSDQKVKGEWFRLNRTHRNRITDHLFSVGAREEDWGLGERNHWSFSNFVSGLGYLMRESSTPR